MLRVKAPAKINLCLHVGDRREDGYHELESLVVFADVGDELAFQDADKLTLAVDGPFASTLSAERDNLVLRAARGVAAIAGRDIPKRITLVKNLPVASGMGGGSADAGATIRAFLLEWPRDEIKLLDFAELAAKLGSDVPVCFFGQNAWMLGRGDEIYRCEVPELHAVLINPGVSVSTRNVFAHLRKRTGLDSIERPDGFETAADLIEFLQTTNNDLEAPAVAIAPAIAEVLSALRGSDGIRFARMSGSGATCFGLFEDAAHAQSAAGAIQSNHPNWWTVAAVLAKSDPD
ncbi:MAG TPA: 4-(cytidine 5'-diphospho)-2-C-methyl-D-erythritol kinase [Rhizomicrobium sp.]|jgi:4-diphosphocytidyl-2-C-methyl-D-erythritol kinase|nr:4-(cytidine 5'-diphospho)-2-C-methyl-D-erythritol kinase [Rhizomicrobium sp.]